MAAGTSSREPTATQNPRVTDLAPGMTSLKMRTPQGKTVR
jgi:hypothetical protein